MPDLASAWPLTTAETYDWLKCVGRRFELDLSPPNGSDAPGNCDFAADFLKKVDVAIGRLLLFAALSAADEPGLKRALETAAHEDTPLTVYPPDDLTPITGREALDSALGLERLKSALEKNKGVCSPS
jgi:hypothetical protein